MLVLSRKIGEVITIGNSISVRVLSFDRGVVRLGIEAPKNIPVHRKEINDKIIEMNRLASKTELDALKSVIAESGMTFFEDKQSLVDTPQLIFSSKKQPG
jgi:carbon storage regulator